MKRIIAWLAAAVLLLSGAGAENISDRIIILDDFPAPAAPAEEREPWKPVHLAEADRATIGSDERVIIARPEEYPYSAIAYLDVTGSCVHGGWYASGFMIEKDLMMTAGHCLYCPLCHAPAQEIDFYFGYRNARNYTVCNRGDSWQAYVPRQVAEGKDYQRYDYAVIRLDENVGVKTGYFAIRHDVPDDELSGASFHVTGYRNGVLRQDMDRVEPVDERYLIHYADTEQQNSGCPVYDQDNRVIAIHTAEGKEGTRNYAVRITGDIYAEIERHR